MTATHRDRSDGSEEPRDKVTVVHSPLRMSPPLSTVRRIITVKFSNGPVAEASIGQETRDRGVVGTDADDEFDELASGDDDERGSERDEPVEDDPGRAFRRSSLYQAALKLWNRQQEKDGRGSNSNLDVKRDDSVVDAGIPTVAGNRPIVGGGNSIGKGRWTEEEETRLLELRNEGKTWSQVAVDMGRSESGCIQHLAKMRIRGQSLSPRLLGWA
ncbi:hypothetical protein JCM10212_000716 [Sporobolomyces blumeae]